MIVAALLLQEISKVGLKYQRQVLFSQCIFITSMAGYIIELQLQQPRTAQPVPAIENKTLKVDA